MTAPNRQSQGFTLLELSIVLVIIGLVTAGGLTILVASVKQRQYEETIAKMKVIQKTVLDYRRAFDRIPKPADITAPVNSASFGTEGSDGTVPGLVPVKELGLPDDYAFDGWGHRFLYATVNRATAENAFTTYPIDSPDCAFGNNLYVYGQYSRGSLQIITACAAQVLMSYGANGFCAPSRSNGTSLLGNNSTNTEEAINCHYPGCTIGRGCLSSGDYVQSLPYQTDPTNPATAFDDIVLYKTRANLPGLTE